MITMCTMCESTTSDLVPWGSERLCWPCADAQLDLMAAAMGDLPVTVEHLEPAGPDYADDGLAMDEVTAAR